MKTLHFRITSITFVLIALSLSACSRSPLAGVNEILSGKKRVNYENNATVKDLEFPPDLTAPEYDRAFDLPSLGKTVSLRSGGYISSNAFPRTSVNSRPSASQRTGNLSSVRSQGGETVLQIHDSYQRALILTDIMLARMGFSVVSRNTTGNVMRAQYNGNNVSLGEAPSKGRIASFFDRTKRLIGVSSKSSFALEKGKMYQISIASSQGINLLRVSGDAGQALPASAKSKIISMLNTEFNR